MNRSLVHLLRKLLFVVFLPLSLMATDCIPDCDCATDWTMEVRGAYYYLPNKDVKKVYTDQWLDYQVEIAKRVTHFMEIWGGVSWATKHGHTHRKCGYYREVFKDSTRIFVLPISLGLKAIYSICPFVDVYAGAGACYSFLRIKNKCKDDYYYRGFAHSPFKKEIDKSDFGGVFKLGVHYAMSTSTYLDLFADYYTQKFDLSKKSRSCDVFRHDIDCSGFKIGLGFGVYF